MKTKKQDKKPTLFVGNYFDGDSDNYLIFVADKDCDTYKEMKKAYFVEEEKPLDNADILDIWPLTEVMDYNIRDSYDIKLTKIK